MVGQTCGGDLMMIAFASRLVRCDAPAILRLAQQAWRKNVSAGLTGEMRIDGACIRQTVEGEASALLPIAAKILADARHTEIEVIAFGAIDDRSFADWRVHGLAMAQPPVAASLLPVEARIAGPVRRSA